MIFAFNNWEELTDIPEEQTRPDLQPQIPEDGNVCLKLNDLHLQVTFYLKVIC